MSSTIPAGVPRLDKLVADEAARLAKEAVNDQIEVIRASHGRSTHAQDLVNALPAEWVYRASLAARLRDLSRRESRAWAADALASLVGVEVGETPPSWAYTPARGDSVASWVLEGARGCRWSLCDYPPDIEAVLGPPSSSGRDGRPVSVRNLPTDWAASMSLALVTACQS